MKKYKITVKPFDEEEVLGHIFIYAEDYTSAVRISNALFDNTGMVTYEEEVKND